MKIKCPKKVTVKAETSDKFFHGKTEFRKIITKLVKKGFDELGLTDILEEDTTIKYTGRSVHYSYYCSGGHSTELYFKGKYLEGSVEVKHFGKDWEGGQIAQIIITLTKCKVPKVVFTSV